MRAQPERLKLLDRLGGGAQAVVELMRYRLEGDEIARFASEGWSPTFTGRTREVAQLLLVSKRIPGQRSQLPSDLEADLDDARVAWARLAREHHLLRMLDGVGVPRVPFPVPLTPPGSGDDPWSNRVLMAHISGSTLEFLAHSGIRPDADQLVAMARALAATLQHAASLGIVHRDVSPTQVIIPPLPGGGPDWSHPVLVDFAFGYHRDVPLLDAHGQSLRTVSLRDLGHTPGFEAPEWWGFHHQQPATDDELATMVTWDVFGWAQTCAFAAAGGWLFGSREKRTQEGRLVGDAAYADLMVRRDVDYATTPPTHIDRVPPALRPAILAGLHPDPRHRTWDDVAPLLPAGARGTRIADGSSAEERASAATPGAGPAAVHSSATEERPPLSRGTVIAMLVGAIATMAIILGLAIAYRIESDQGAADASDETTTEVVEIPTTPPVESIAVTDEVTVSSRTLAASDLTPPATLSRDSASGGWVGARRSAESPVGPVDDDLNDRRAVRQGPCTEGENTYRDLVLAAGRSATLLQEDDETFTVVSDGSGSEVWRAPATPAACSLLEAAGDLLLVPHAEDGTTMTTYDLRTGESLWRLRATGLEGRPYLRVMAVHDGVVVVAVSDVLIAADAVTGDLAWAVETNGSTVAAAGSEIGFWRLGYGGTVEVRGWDDGRLTVAAASLGNGEDVGPGSLIRSPEGDVMALHETGAEGARTTVVAGFTPDGTETWRTPLDQALASHTVVPGERLFVTSGRTLFTIDRVTGAVLEAGGYEGVALQVLVSAGDDLILVRSSGGTNSVCFASRSTGYDLDRARCDTSFPGDALVPTLDETGRWWIPRDGDLAVGL